MPITKGALKKQRADKVKTAANRTTLSRVKSAEKTALKNPSATTIAALFSAVDKAVKKHVMKLNTASRLKAKVNRAAKAKK